MATVASPLATLMVVMQYCISIPYTAPHSAERCLNGGSVVFSDGGRSDLSSAAGGRSAAAASVARRRTLRLPASLPTTFLRPRQSPSPGTGQTRRDRGRQPASRLRAEHQVRRQGPPTGQGRHRQGGTAGEERDGAGVAAGRFSDRRPLVSCVHMYVGIVYGDKRRCCRAGVVREPDGWSNTDHLCVSLGRTTIVC